MRAFMLLAAATAALTQIASSTLVTIPLHRRSSNSSFTNTDLTFDDGLVSGYSIIHKYKVTPNLSDSLSPLNVKKLVGTASVGEISLLCRLFPIESRIPCLFLHKSHDPTFVLISFFGIPTAWASTIYIADH